MEICSPTSLAAKAEGIGVFCPQLHVCGQCETPPVSSTGCLSCQDGILAGKCWAGICLSAAWGDNSRLRWETDALWHSLCSSRDFCSSGVAAPAQLGPSSAFGSPTLWFAENFRVPSCCQEKLISKARQKKIHGLRV